MLTHWKYVCGVDKESNCGEISADEGILLSPIHVVTTLDRV